MSKYLTVVSTTTTNGPDNFAPYAVITIDAEAVCKRIAMVEKLMGRRRKSAVRPANLAFWSDEVVEIEWLTELPPKWLSASQMKKLEDRGFVFTRKIINQNAIAHTRAYVSVEMSVFWDSSFGVECQSKHSDERYEASTFFYADIKREIAREGK